MKAVELKVTRIGSSRGVRLPASVLRRYKIGETLILEERPDEIALRPKPTAEEKHSWGVTYNEMAASNEDWSDWEALPEGLRELPDEHASHK